MNIKEFIEHKKDSQERKYRSQSAAEAVMGSVDRRIKDWVPVFKAGGYYQVVPAQTREWQEIHKWCVRSFGPEHYAWNGHNFWFETPEDATMFALRWGSR